ncbi:putative metallo-beta-lactamase, ribonuclease Z/Hydroxyacylglutathione hydrolase [Septoria linicola]|nr:putative metallo-beta-lactamase, ribonuclease Z/Hydroxyacylglutathione hydrolase [Septoria linicola]
MSLRASVYVAPAIPFVKADGSRGGPTGSWSPISCTLIHGEKEAVLVDTPITNAQNEDLIKWIEETIPSKKLTTLDIQIEPKEFKSAWGDRFPGEIDTSFVLANPLPDNGEFQLEGHLLKAIEVGHSDTHDSTVLWVPSIKLAVCGDVVYGDVNQMLAFAKTKALQEEWIRAIEAVEALKPEIVVAGHKKPGELDGSYHLGLTKQYIRDYGELIERGQAKDGRQLGKLMLQKYPSRLNPGALYAGCATAFGKSSNSRL